MEHVKGIPITEHCDKHRLTIKERLRLFLHVCEAIQHAHQKGIIHRDIKPSNILVVIQDQEMIPKVIDFGVARAISQPLTERTLYTEQGQIIGTPEYMSPEQAEMTSQDIDTRSDIYSLGAVLYELLTGVQPFESDTLRQGSPDHLRQVIREQDPKTPSSRLSNLTHEDFTRIAQYRQVDGGVLRRTLHGDLEWIVMKCLEKDRTRRYETANELAMDLKRYLANEAVVARPPTVVYRLQKAWRRNRLLYSSVAAVGVALIVGLALAVSGWQQAARQRNRAIIERTKAETAQASEAALRQQAQRQELAARRRAYAADMVLAQQAMEENNLGRTWKLLDRQRPESGEEDLRGWEWRYLWSQSRPDRHEVFFSGNRRLDGLGYNGDFLLWYCQGEMTVVSVQTRKKILSRTDCWRAVFARRAPWIACAQRRDEEDVIVLWDLSASREVCRLSLGGQTHWLGFTPDDHLLVSLSYHPNTSREPRWQLTTWDTATGQCLLQQAIVRYNENRYRIAAISPDAQWIAVATGSSFRVLQLDEGSERFVRRVGDSRITALAFSPDGSKLLVAAGIGSPDIHCWDIGTGDETGVLKGHHSYVTALQFTPDGKHLVSSSTDQTIRLWDWPTGRSLAALRGHPDEVDGLALSPKGDTFASRCRDGSIFLWPLHCPAQTPAYRTLPVKVATHYGGWAQPRPVVFAPDSRSIIAIEPDGALTQWDLATLQRTRRWKSESQKTGKIVIAPNASQAAILDFEGRLSLLDLSTGVERTAVIHHPNAIELVWLSGNARHLVTASFHEGRSMFDTGFWDLPEGHLMKMLQVPTNSSFANDLGPTEWYLGYSGSVRIWDISRPQAEPRELFPGERGEVIRTFTVSPDGRLGAGCFEEGYIRIWDTGTAEPLQMMRVFLHSPHSVIFSPDGHRLVAASDSHEAVKIWETATWQEVLTLAGEGTTFGYVAFSPDGQTLVARNSQGLLHIWSAPPLDTIEKADAAAASNSVTLTLTH
jgi:WD40 repeat protein